MTKRIPRDQHKTRGQVRNKLLIGNETEKNELEAEFGDDEYYPPNLRTTTISERIFAFYYVRSENGSEAVRKANLFKPVPMRDVAVYNTSCKFKTDPLVQQLIQHEKKKLLEEIRLKTVRFSDCAVEALKDVLNAKSAVARVQAAMALLNVAGIAENTEAQHVLDEKPLQLITRDKRMELIRAAGDSFADDEKK